MEKRDLVDVIAELSSYGNLKAQMEVTQEGTVNLHVLLHQQDVDVVMDIALIDKTSGTIYLHNIGEHCILSDNIQVSIFSKVARYLTCNRVSLLNKRSSSTLLQAWLSYYLDRVYTANAPLVIEINHNKNGYWLAVGNKHLPREYNEVIFDTVANGLTPSFSLSVTTRKITVSAEVQGYYTESVSLSTQKDVKAYYHNLGDKLLSMQLSS